MRRHASPEDQGSPLSFGTISSQTRRPQGSPAGARPVGLPRSANPTSAFPNQPSTMGDSSYEEGDTLNTTFGTHGPIGEGTSRGSSGAFHIIVATRIRPFNKNELKRWRKEQQKRISAMMPQIAAAAAAAAAGNNGGSGVGSSNIPNVGNGTGAQALRAALNRKRHNERQPFGPAGARASPPAGEALLPLVNGKEIDPELLATLSEANPEMAEALRHAQRHFFKGASGSPRARGSGLEDGQDDSPLPVVDVEPDQRTVTLLDPANPSVARGAFTFDHVFSSFAPTVELLLPGTAAAKEAGRHATPGVHGVNMHTAILSEDTVLSPEQEMQAEEEQARIYELLGRPLLESALNGFNACIFAYGQTSSGKTYTMLGTKRHWGIIPRLLHSLFEHLHGPGDGGSGDGANVTDEDRFGREDSGGSPLSLPPVTRGVRQGPRADWGTTERTASSAGSASPHLPPAPTSSASQLSPSPHPGISRSNSNGNSGDSTVHVDVAYMEIYNEQVRDLLKQRPKNAILHYNSRFDAKDVNHNEYQTLRVRQHPEHGLYVDGLTTVRVRSWEECGRYLKEGSQLRTQAATSMNETSSRSHAIFQVTITRVEQLGGRVRGKLVTSERVSKINLVDLAGSERNSVSATSTKGKKSHVQEANSINVSLSTLRRVIDALVTNNHILQYNQNSARNGAANAKPLVVVPYRESLLTYVLSDNFGGNSRTVMCANISPCEYNLNETESTLRYAALARGVRNRVKVNEDPSARVIHELQHRVQQLQDELAMSPSPQRLAELELDLEENTTALGEAEARHAEEVEALRQELQLRQAQETRWRAVAEQGREESARLMEVVRRLQEENASLLAAAAAAEAEAKATAASRERSHSTDPDDVSASVSESPFTHSEDLPQASADRDRRRQASRSPRRQAAAPGQGKANQRGRGSLVPTGAGNAAKRPSLTATPRSKGTHKNKGQRGSMSRVGDGTSSGSDPYGAGGRSPTTTTTSPTATAARLARSPSKGRQPGGRGAVHGGGGGSPRAASIASRTPAGTPTASAGRQLSSQRDDASLSGGGGGGTPQRMSHTPQKPKRPARKKTTASSAPPAGSGKRTPSVLGRRPSEGGYGERDTREDPILSPRRRQAHPQSRRTARGEDGVTTAALGASPLSLMKSRMKQQQQQQQQQPTGKERKLSLGAPALLVAMMERGDTAGVATEPRGPQNRTAVTATEGNKKHKGAREEEEEEETAEGTSGASPLSRLVLPHVDSRSRLTTGPDTRGQEEAEGAIINQTSGWLTPSRLDVTAAGRHSVDSHSSAADYSVGVAPGQTSLTKRKAHGGGDGGGDGFLLPSHPARAQPSDNYHEGSSDGSSAQAARDADMAAVLGVMAAAVRPAMHPADSESVRRGPHMSDDPLNRLRPVEHRLRSGNRDDLSGTLDADDEVTGDNRATAHLRKASVEDVLHRYRSLRDDTEDILRKARKPEGRLRSGDTQGDNKSPNSNNVYQRENDEPRKGVPPTTTSLAPRTFCTESFLTSAS